MKMDSFNNLPFGGAVVLVYKASQRQFAALLSHAEQRKPIQVMHV